MRIDGLAYKFFLPILKSTYFSLLGPPNSNPPCFEWLNSLWLLEPNCMKGDPVLFYFMGYGDKSKFGLWLIFWHPLPMSTMDSEDDVSKKTYLFAANLSSTRYFYPCFLHANSRKIGFNIYWAEYFASLKSTTVLVYFLPSLIAL